MVRKVFLIPVFKGILPFFFLFSNITASSFMLKVLFHFSCNNVHYGPI